MLRAMVETWVVMCFGAVSTVCDGYMAVLSHRKLGTELSRVLTSYNFQISRTLSVITQVYIITSLLA